MLRNKWAAIYRSVSERGEALNESDQVTSVAGPVGLLLVSDSPVLFIILHHMWD